MSSNCLDLYNISSYYKCINKVEVKYCMSIADEIMYKT